MARKRKNTEAKSVTGRLSPETETQLREVYGPQWFALERAAWAKYVVTTRRDRPEFWLRMTTAYLQTTYEVALAFKDLQADYDPSYLFQCDPNLLGPLPDVPEEPVEDCEPNDLGEPRVGCDPEQLDQAPCERRSDGGRIPPKDNRFRGFGLGDVQDGWHVIPVIHGDSEKKDETEDER